MGHIFRAPATLFYEGVDVHAHIKIRKSLINHFTCGLISIFSWQIYSPLVNYIIFIEKMWLAERFLKVFKIYTNIFRRLRWSNGVGHQPLRLFECLRAQSINLSPLKFFVKFLKIYFTGNTWSDARARRSHNEQNYDNLQYLSCDIFSIKHINAIVLEISNRLFMTFVITIF